MCFSELRRQLPFCWERPKDGSLTKWDPWFRGALQPTNTTTTVSTLWDKPPPPWRKYASGESLQRSRGKSRQIWTFGHETMVATVVCLGWRWMDVSSLHPPWWLTSNGLTFEGWWNMNSLRSTYWLEKWKQVLMLGGPQQMQCIHMFNTSVCWWDYSW